MKLIKLMAKNVRILMRSRSAASIIFIGPLIILLLAGIAFNNIDPVALNVGVYNANTETAQQFIASLESEYAILNYRTQLECETGVKSGEIHACIAFPKEFVIEQGRTNVIELFVDGSRANIADLIQRSLYAIIRQESTQITESLAFDLIVNIDLSLEEIQRYQQTHMRDLLQQTDVLSNQLDNLSQTLLYVNVSYDDNRLSLSGVESTSDDIDDSASDVRGAARDALREYERLAEDLLDLNISSSLNNDAQSALTRAGTIKSTLNTASSELEQAQDQLVGDVRLANALLLELKQQLTLAQQEKSKADDKADDQRSSINQTRSILSVYGRDLDKTITRLGGIENTNATSISLPVSTNTNTVTGNISKLQSVLPQLMVMVVMLVGMLLASLLIVMEKKSKAQFRMFTIPLPAIYHSFAMFFTVLFVVLLQIFIMLLLAGLVFAIDVFSNALTIVILLLVSGAVFICIGMMIGYIFSTQHTAILAGVSLSTLFILLSDLILPLESMPILMQNIVDWTPFVVSANGVRTALLFEGGLLTTNVVFWILLGCSIILFTLMTLMHKFAHEVIVINQHRKNKEHS